jgi:beta-xylosidase
MKKILFLMLAASLTLGVGAKKKKTSGNPIFTGWYADPEGAVLDGQYWVFPTFSAPYDKQLFFDAFSSPDLVNWTKHERVLEQKNIPWLRRALWAPAVIEANNKFYVFFGGNDVHEGEIGGIGVAVADRPEGPYKDALGKPLINEIVNGAQPIDQFVFRDDDGQYYMYYGGWRHCNMCKLSPDLLSIVPWEDGQKFHEVTPSEEYVEGPFMLKRKGKYYFMWSEGGWTGPNYCVAYAVSDSPFGPFERKGIILKRDENVARGAGHHSVIQVPGKDEYYIIYHRRPLTETDGNSRETCIDKLIFNSDGTIRPVKMTFEGVKARKIKRKK